MISPDSPDATTGHVLLLCDDGPQSDRLSRWIRAAGHEVVVLSGKEKFLLNEGDDPRVNLVVSDLDSDDPAVRKLLDHLLGGDLFRAIPQVHVFRDLALMRTWCQTHPALAAYAVPAPPAAEEFQSRVRLAAEVGRLQRDLARHSTRDGLTTLANRRYLLLRLGEEFSRSRRYRTPLSFALCDIDRLKEINDRYGQAAGDTVIRRLGELLSGQVRREDVLGRMGEDVFGIALPGNRYRGAATLANKIRTEVEETVISAGGAEIALRVSCGISTYPDNRAIQTPDDLVARAESALREAKARGGNRVFIDEGVLRTERPVILIVDADAHLLDLAEDLLVLDDFRVVKAANARTALETLTSHEPDLLVLDVGMIDDDEGVALIERVQHLFPGTRFPIIGLSGDPAADADRLARLGVDRFITKPFSVSLLRSAARELFDAYRT
jgi:diguanylate cyclase (GGDEF)-like protein